MNLMEMERVFSDLAEIGKSERTVTVKGLKIRLRALTAEEEVEVQKRATEIIAEDEDSSEATKWQKWIFEVLSLSIVQVGDLDLRGRFIETGEVNEAGNPIKIETPQAIKQIMNKQKWSSQLIQSLGNEYLKLLTQNNEEVENAIEYDPQDIALEIERREGIIKKHTQEIDNLKKKLPKFNVEEFESEVEDPKTDE